MINIPSDLRKNKETIIGNMDFRETICMLLGSMLSIGVLYYIRVVVRYKNILVAAFFAGLILIPFLFIGFKKVHGMKINDYFKIYVNNKILSRVNRLPVCRYEEKQVLQSKYEMIRIYKLEKAEEIVRLREHLVENKNLILTEYIDIKNNQYVIFRLDGKNLILEQIRRNKEAILNIANEIKDFIKNEIKPLKKEKSEKLKELHNKLVVMRKEKKFLQKKSFNTLKGEVDIFEKLANVKVSRISTKEEIDTLRSSIEKDERTLFELNLFNKSHYSEYINNFDKILIINDKNEVDTFIFAGTDNVKNTSENVIDCQNEVNFSGHMGIKSNYTSVKDSNPIVDLLDIDKATTFYKTTILSLEARNQFNQYRKVK